jgi:hypothetical protein
VVGHACSGRRFELSCRHKPDLADTERERTRIRPNKNPPFPASFRVGAPRFELRTYSPPDSFNVLAGGPGRWRDVASLRDFQSFHSCGVRLLHE